MGDGHHYVPQIGLSAKHHFNVILQSMVDTVIGQNSTSAKL